MWLNKLKIAVAEKDTDKLAELLDNIPKFDNLKDIEKAAFLLKNAMDLLENLKNETALSMKRVKKNLDFLKSTQPSTPNKLDIKS